MSNEAYTPQYNYVTRLQLNMMVKKPTNAVIVSPKVERDISEMLVYIEKLEKRVSDLNLELRITKWGL